MASGRKVLGSQQSAVNLVCIPSGGKEMAALEERYSALEARYAVLEGKYTLEKDRNSKREKRYRALRVQCAKLQEKYAQYEARVEMVEGKLGVLDESYAELESTADAMFMDIAQVRTAIGVLVLSSRAGN